MAKGKKGSSKSSKPSAGQKALDEISKGSKSVAQVADDLYNEVNDVPAADLKALINGIKAASKKKTAANTRVSKKGLQNLKAQLEAEADAAAKKEAFVDLQHKATTQDAKDDAAQTDQSTKDLKVKKKAKEKEKKKLTETQGFEKSLDILRKAVKKKTLESRTIGADDVAKLKALFVETNSALLKMLAKSGTLDKGELQDKAKSSQLEVLSLKKQIDTLDAIARINDQRRARDLAIHGEQKKPGYDDLYKSGFQRFLDKGRDEKGNVSLSRSMVNAASMFGRKLKANAKDVISPLANYERGVQWAVSKAGTNTKMVSAILKTDRAIRYLGGAVKDVGKDSYEWLHKTMGSMFSYLKHKWGQLNSGGAGALGSLLGIGMLFESLIKPIIEGIDKKLSDTYGEHYIKDFIGKMWDKSKTWLIQSLKDFIFGTPEENKKERQDFNAKHASDPNVEIFRANEVFQKLSKEDQDSVRPRHGSLMRSIGASPYESEKLLADALAAYNAATTPAAKKAAALDIQMIMGAKQGITLSQPLYDGLQKAGFTVTAFKKGGARPVTAIGAPMAAVPAGGVQRNPNAPPVYTGKASGSQVSPPPAGATAAKPPQPASAPSGSKTVPSSSGTAPGAGNAAIPKTAVSDGFHAFNLDALS